MTLSRDLLVTGARIVDVVTQSVYDGWFTVADGRFMEVEEGELPAALDFAATRRLDLAGAYVQPGMLDIHMHIESSLVTPRRFAEAALPHGTTTILQDPHEVANVLGAPGIRWMLESSRGLPLRIFTAISSCVPATSSDIETPNASISPAEVTELARESEVLALGEMMDFQGLVQGDEHLSAMLKAAWDAGLTLEGHVPSLTGPELSRYIAYGIRSDHTLMTREKLLEQLRKGLWVMVQEKSLTPEVVKTITALPDRSRVVLITDDVMPNRLVSGHLSRLVETAVAAGWPVLDAVAAATLRPASYLGLHDLGVIAPGAKADFLVTSAVGEYPPCSVYVEGRLEAENGVAESVKAAPPPEPDGLRERFATSIFTPADFRLTGAAGRSTLTARVIEVNQVNSFTTLSERDVELLDGVPVAEDLVLATVIPRAAVREGAGPFSPVVALVSGLGLRRGGYASTFAHDSHNVFVLGRDPHAMAAALDGVLTVGGGMAFCEPSDPGITLLELPLAGLLSDLPIESVAESFDALERALRTAGVSVKHPVLLLTLLPLSVSPDFKVTDLGIVDVQARRILAPVVEEEA